MDYSLPEIKLNIEALQKLIQSRILLYFVVLLLVLKIAAISVSINIPQNVFFADITKLTLENLANQTRQSLGLQPLKKNQKLDQAAQMKAQNMVENNYFSHTSPQGITPWYWFLQAGYIYKYAGENLAVGFYDSQELYQAWLNSASHQENIINPNYTEFGTAVLKGFGSNNAIVVVQEFASPALTKQVPAKQVSANSNPEPAAAAAPFEPATSSQKVLAQTTEVQASLHPVKDFILYNYDNLLQNIIYGVSLLVIGILLSLIFFSSDIDFKKGFVFRAVLIVILLSAATLLNKELIVSFIPHQILI